MLSHMRKTPRDMKGTMPLSHVLGHQDDNVAHEKSPILAQLNVDADKLVTKHLEESAITQCGVPLCETTKCCFCTQGKVITSKHKNKIRTAHSIRRFRTAVEKKHGWSTEIWNAVNWKVFGTAIGRIFTHRKRIFN